MDFCSWQKTKRLSTPTGSIYPAPVADALQAPVPALPRVVVGARPGALGLSAGQRGEGGRTGEKVSVEGILFLDLFLLDLFLFLLDLIDLFLFLFNSSLLHLPLLHLHLFNLPSPSFLHPARKVHILQVSFTRVQKILIFDRRKHRRRRPHAHKTSPRRPCTLPSLVSTSFPRSKSSAPVCNSGSQRSCP